MSEFVFVFLVCIVFVLVLTVIYNNIITTKKYSIKTGKVNSPLRIVFLPDLFTNTSASRINLIIEKTKKLRPDLVVITGASLAENGGVTDSLITKLSSFAEVLCVNTPPVLSRLGCICIPGGELRIVNEYSLVALPDNDVDDLLTCFSRLENFKIAVVSKPSFFGEPVNISSYDIDLVLSWHSDGQLINIPFFGALYTKEDGFFPRYSRGIYREKGSTLVISAGVGKSVVPLRLNNFRQIVTITVEN